MRFVINHFLFLALLLSGAAIGQSAGDDSGDDWGDDEWGEDEWGEDSKSSLWHGFAEGGYGYRFDRDPLFDNQETLNEARLYLESDRDLDQFSLSFKGEGWYDGIVDGYLGEIREAVVKFSLFDNTDITAGRQVTTWGTGDLVFLNDQFPKAWDGFFNGRDDVYVKAPANAVRATSYFDAVNVDVVWTPRFTPDNFINGEYFSFFSAFAAENVGGRNVINDKMPEGGIANSELALRLYKNIDGVEYALYGYRGFDKLPVGISNDFRPTYHRRNIWGASARGSGLGGLYNAEFSYEDARDDRNGTNPLVNNGLSKLLLGYERELVPKLNLGLQYLVEKVADHEALIANSFAPQFERDSNRQWITARIMHKSMQDKLTLNLFTIYSLSEKKPFLRWNANYRYSDNWTYVVGFNLVRGEKPNGFFGQFENASNAYVRVRYNF